MQTHEAALLRRQWATEGGISYGDQGRVLIELEQLLQEQSLMRYRLDELAKGPWLEIRRVLEGLAEVFDSGDVKRP